MGGSLRTCAFPFCLFFSLKKKNSNTPLIQTRSPFHSIPVPCAQAPVRKAGCGTRWTKKLATKQKGENSVQREKVKKKIMCKRRGRRNRKQYRWCYDSHRNKRCPHNVTSFPYESTQGKGVGGERKENMVAPRQSVEGCIYFPPSLSNSSFRSLHSIT